MENFFFILAVLVLFMFIIGMFKPDLFVPEKFKIEKKRLFIFFMSLALFWLFSFCGSSIQENNMTPQEKIARDEQQRIEKENQNNDIRVKDSLKNAVNEKSTQKNNSETISSFETKKGDLVNAGNQFSIEVIKIKDKKRNALVFQHGYGKYRYFYLKITNTSKQPLEMDRDYFYVESEDGSIYKHNTEQAITDFLITINRDAFNDEDLAPKVPAKGIIAFELPKEGKFKLRYNH